MCKTLFIWSIIFRATRFGGGGWGGVKVICPVHIWRYRNQTPIRVTVEAVTYYISCVNISSTHQHWASIVTRWEIFPISRSIRILSAGPKITYVVVNIAKATRFGRLATEVALVPHNMRTSIRQCVNLLYTVLSSAFNIESYIVGPILSESIPPIEASIIGTFPGGGILVDCCVIEIWQCL